MKTLILRILAIFVLISCFLASGCAAEGPRDPEEPRDPNGCQHTYKVSSAFNELELDAIFLANKEWNAVGNVHICLVMGESKEHNIRKMVYGGPEWQAKSKSLNDLNFIGLYQSLDDNITIVDNLGPVNLHKVALHEFGHARGLPHINDPAAIMNPSMNPLTPNYLSPADITECHRVGACGSGPVLTEVSDHEIGDTHPYYFGGM